MFSSQTLFMDSDNEKISFKKNLAKVFDDDLRTRPLKWNNYVDIVIIAMIVLSTVSVFLTTFTLSPAWEKAVNIFDWIVQIFFTIEVSLRIWAADEIDPKYKGLWGRVRYCFSFYGLIDFLATYPILIGMACPSLMLSSKLFQIFRVLRIARLFHVFRYMPAFRFLGEAFGSKKKEIFVSLQFLVIITIVLSFILFLLERDENPEMLGDGWRSIVWSFAKYIGDPGKIVDEPLVTTGGKIISFLVGILGIAIFAVPIGLLSSGFSEAIEKDKRTNELNDFRQRIRKSFSRDINISLRNYLEKNKIDRACYFVPQRVSIAKLQVRKGMDVKDVIDTCNAFPEFRLKNLASAFSGEEHPMDHIVVEHFPHNRSYGCCIDRASRVTIVCTGGFNELGSGWFTYYLALMGGFNYISKEFEVDPDELDSFYNLYMQKCNKMTEAQLKEANDVEGLKKLQEKKDRREAFLNDLKKMAGREGAWVVLITTSIKNSDNKLDFHFAHTLKDGTAPTVNDLTTYKQMFEHFEREMREESLASVMPSERYPLHKLNLGYTLCQEHPYINVFALRPSTDVVNFNTRRHIILYRMAQLFSEHFDNSCGPRPEDIDEMKRGGFGYIETNKETK